MLHNTAMIQNIPVLLIFVVAWFVLKLLDYAESFSAGWNLYMILRLVTVLVGLILVLI